MTATYLRWAASSAARPPITTMCDQESARGLNDLVLRYGIALGYGVITTENKEQALARARRDRHDRAGAAARACLAMIELKRQFHSSK